MYLFHHWQREDERDFVYKLVGTFFADNYELMVWVVCVLLSSTEGISENSQISKLKDLCLNEDKDLS
jgi:hypothetical protein